jgi:anti-anti-sigma factor
MGERMASASQSGFTYEVLTRHDSVFGKITNIKCHGRLTSASSEEIKALVKPLLDEGGRTVMDLADLEFLDSSGLGVLVGLKVTALKKGLCRFELDNLNTRVKDLLSLANLTQLFAK